MAVAFLAVPMLRAAVRECGESAATLGGSERGDALWSMLLRMAQLGVVGCCRDVVEERRTPHGVPIRWRVPDGRMVSVERPPEGSLRVGLDMVEYTPDHRAERETGRWALVPMAMDEADLATHAAESRAHHEASGR